METYGSHGPEAAPAIFAGCFLIVWLLIVLALFLFSIFVYWKIFSKAGYSGALSLLVLIPGIGALICLLILAFGQWPIYRQLDAYRNAQQAPPPQG